MSGIALVSRPDGLAPDAFEKELGARCRPLAAGGGALRLYLADVDQGPLSRSGDNDTRPPRFDAAVLAGGDGRALRAALDGLGELRAYRARGRVIKAAAPRPGVFMVSPVFRAAQISHAAFDRHWRRRHAPLALCHHPGMCEYEQQVIEEVLTPDAPGFDGVALLGFPRIEDYRERMFGSDEGRAAIFADTRRFLDLRRSEAVLAREARLASPPA